MATDDHTGLETNHGTSQGDPAGKYSIASVAPQYPRYRTPLIVLVVVLIFVALLAGIHFGVQGAKSSLDKFFKDPVQHIAALILGSDRYDVCESFLKQNERQLAVLGSNFKYYPIREAVRVINGRQRATVVIRVQGSRATKDVIFRLQEHHGRWKIRDVVLDLGLGSQERLYP